MECRTILYTAEVDNTPKRLAKDIQQLRQSLSYLIEDTTAASQGRKAEALPADKAELLIVDEADRLKTQSLEQMRDLYDRGQFGLVLIGIPGLEKRLARILNSTHGWDLSMLFAPSVKRRRSLSSIINGSRSASIYNPMTLRMLRP